MNSNRLRLLCTILLFFFCHITHGQYDSSQSLLELEAIYSALPWYNARGGIETGFAYMDNVDLTAKINLEQVFKLKNDFSLFIYGLGNHGDRATDLMGDFQVASNIEAVSTWRIFEFWLQKNFIKDRLSVLIGLYDLNSEFDVLKPATLFINSSFGIGADYAQSGVNGPSIFPVSSFGIRLASFVGQRTRIRLAVLDGVPGDPGNVESNEIKLSRNEGLLIAGEMAVYTGRKIAERAQKQVERPHLTRRRKVGRQYDVYDEDKINLGGWYYTDAFQPIADSLSVESGNFGLYVGAQKYLTLNEKNDFIALFARYGIANAKFNRLSSALSAGLVFSVPLFDLEDHLGVAFSSGFNGDRFQNTLNSAEEAETAIEFTYSLHLKPWLLLQPDVQYIINPSTREELENPLSVALLIQVSMPTLAL